MIGTTVGEAGEREIIRLIRRLFPSSRPDVLRGIGDDAAVVRPGRKPWVLTKDLLVEDVDFRRPGHPPFLLGRKSLAVSLSDAAAMGARPALALLGLGLPAGLETSWLRDFLRGFRAMAREHGVDLIGGDLSAAREILISVTVLAKAGRTIGRDGARPGDLVCVSGHLGDASLGFALLEAGAGSGRGSLGPRRAFLDPSPRVGLGRELARLGLPSAMIDVSDGLSVDLAHVCQESRVGAEIDLAALPVSPALRRLDPKKALDHALNGGEDFELLFTVRPTKRARELLERIRRRHAVTTIGRITAGRELMALFGKGDRRPLAVKGYQHFRG